MCLYGKLHFSIHAKVFRDMILPDQCKIASSAPGLATYNSDIMGWVMGGVSRVRGWVEWVVGESGQLRQFIK